MLCPIPFSMMITVGPSALSTTCLCTTWINASPGHKTICVNLSGNRKDVTGSPGCFCPPSCKPEAPSVRSQVWSQDPGLVGERYSSPSIWLKVGQFGRTLTLPGTIESKWRGAQGSHCGQLKLKVSTLQTAAASYMQQMLNETLKWKLLCSCLSQQEPYPELAEVCERRWLVTEELREQLVRKE